MACLVLWLPAVFTLRLAAIPIRLVSVPTEARLRRAIFRLFSRSILAILGIRVEVCGRPPALPYLLVSNHLAAVDIFVLGSLMGPIFISHGGVAHWPFAGFVVRSVDTIFIDRQRPKDIVRVNREIVEKLSRGEGIAFFPEATTSGDGNLLPFKASLFEGPVTAKLPVHYAGLSYAAPPGGPTALEAIVWRTNESFLAHFLRIAQLPHSKAIVAFGNEPIMGEDRKVLAQELQEAIRTCRPPLE